VAFEAQFAAALPPDATNPWGWRGLALVRLRAGKLDGVELTLAKAGKEAHALDHAVRGLFALARNDRTAAREQLTKAEELIEAQKPTAANPLAYAGREWHEQVETAILLAELRAAIDTPAAPLPVAPPPRPKE
jgi:hypothetical protein